MILILNTESEASCDLVTDWLDYYSADFSRLDETDLVEEENFLNLFDDNSFVTNMTRKLKLNDVKTIWFRKFGFYAEKKIDNIYSFGVQIDTVNHLKNEYNSYLTIFLKILNLNKNIKWLTNPLILNSNKMEQLLAAKSNCLSVPQTIITSNKKVLLKFYKNNNKQIICKTIKDISHLKSPVKDYYLLMYTNEINAENLNVIPESFFPSLFQVKIVKEMEIRSFYLDGIFYSMAIFSQNDTKTSVDFRRYNIGKQNRMVPYKLPLEIEIKLKNTFETLKLDTGSADLIKTAEGDYVFLEINPSGQYGFVSYCCNYHLDKKVAKHLIKLNNER